MRRPRRPWTGAAVSLVLSLFCFLAAKASALADLNLPTRPRGEPPMRISRIVSSEPSCQPNCPEWISAEGVIEPGTAQVFAKAIDDLGGRRLPILIHSHGGSVVDALKMGVLIRAKGLAVAVARTLISNCTAATPKCASSRGQAITGGAACASACVLVLAGGVERLVGPVPLVGVHQITAAQKRTEGVANLTTTRKVYEPEGVDATVMAYLTAMGVGEPVMTLLRKTSAASLRWLSDDELRNSHLATLRLDSVAPILSAGANGLNGHALVGDPPRPDLFMASGEGSLAPAAGGRELRLEAAFAYRRGGGAVEATIALHGAVGAGAGERPGVDVRSAATAEGGQIQSTGSVGGAPVRLSLPLAGFCGLTHGGRFTASPLGGPAGQGNAALDAPPLQFDVGAMNGARALLHEACP